MVVLNNMIRASESCLKSTKFTVLQFSVRIPGNKTQSSKMATADCCEVNGGTFILWLFVSWPLFSPICIFLEKKLSLCVKYIPLCQPYSGINHMDHMICLCNNYEFISLVLIVHQTSWPHYASFGSISVDLS